MLAELSMLMLAELSMLEFPMATVPKAVAIAAVAVGAMGSMGKMDQDNQLVGSQQEDTQLEDNLEVDTHEVGSLLGVEGRPLLVEGRPQEDNHVHHQEDNHVHHQDSHVPPPQLPHEQCLKEVLCLCQILHAFHLPSLKRRTDVN
ncbi:uncharacterized protein G2W53_020268 [Senna tora]|uniref:Uncharacterized protein n=1 Tax=Senna tora TaxID=362788 RepID=A0A834TWB4_9FABA|nr:uncharacterized protein G2W53_020268 [Senna tora]